MIAALVILPPGAAASTPIQYELSPEEASQVDRLIKDSTDTQDASAEDMDSATIAELVAGEKHEPLEREGPVNGIEDLDMENYDDDDDDEQPQQEEEGGGEDEGEDSEMLDQLQEIEDEGEDEEDPGDVEDHRLKPSDVLIVTANTDEDFSCLEVHVYDDNTGSLYVHHDITLPAFPLSLAWMGCSGDTFGVDPKFRNFVAVGTFLPQIEIWNLDVLDSLEPTVTLGSGGKGPGRRKKGGAGATKDGGSGHTDAVLGVAWNTSHPTLLASGSADKTCKLWDVSREGCVRTFQHHSDKVQSVAWNPTEANVLASGSFDRTVCVCDARAQGARAARFDTSADVECLVWDPHTATNFYVSTEDGVVACHDVRCAGKPALVAFQAHDKAVSSIALSNSVRGMMATASQDKTVKLWDASEQPQPKCLASKPMAIGPVYTCAFDGASPFLLAAGGGNGVLALWHTDEEASVPATFASRVGEQKIAEQQEDAAVVQPDAKGGMLPAQQDAFGAPVTETKSEKPSQKGKKSKKKKKR